MFQKRQYYNIVETYSLNCCRTVVKKFFLCGECYVPTDETYIPNNETYVPNYEMYVPNLGTNFLLWIKNFSVYVNDFSWLLYVLFVV